MNIERANERFEEAFGRQDTEALAALYARDGQLMPSGSPTVEGTDAIAQFWKGVFQAGLDGAELATQEIYLGVDGDITTEVGRYRLTASGEEVDAGRYVVIWLQTVDGWKLYRDIWTTDRASEE